MDKLIFEVKNLTKKFGSFTAVDNISFSLADGEILGLLGPNGAGKTTTIQMLLDVMTPTEGSIKYFGKSFKDHKEEILKEINFSSTYISMPWLFTINELLDLYASLYEVKDKKKRIEKLLREFEFEGFAKKQFYMLSAGEKTRLCIIKAFLNYPKIILLDEPTASLDPEIATKVREFLKKEKNEYNVSMLFTSHNMAEVEEMCDRVLVLHHGKIIDEGIPVKLAEKISDCVIELTIVKDKKRATSFFEEKEFAFGEGRNVFKISVDEKHIADFLTLLAEEKIGYEQISISKPDLEDYFLKTIGGLT